MIGDLVKHGPRTFIEMSLGNEHARSNPLIFVHVAKTAGSSFREELAERYQPAENIFVDFSKLESPVSQELYLSVMDENLSEFDAHHFFKCRMVSGHFSYLQISQKENLSKGRLISFIRNPISRLTSFYDYHCSSAHPDHEFFKSQYPNFRHFIQQPENINSISHQLTAGNSISGVEAASWIKQHYYWIGFQEHYVASCKLLFAMNGMRFSPRHAIRVSETDHMHFDPRDIRLAEELNEFDIQMFNALNEDFAPMWDEIYRLTDYDRVFRSYMGYAA